MKFDCIIINPPYQRNLHLKILAEAIKHLKDEKSVCVNLSPVRWLQDPLAKYKKICDLKRFEKSVAKHIESLEIITAKLAEELFSIGLPFNLGIYSCIKKDLKAFQPILNTEQLLIAKVYEKYVNNTIDKHIVFSKPMKYALPVSMMCGGSGGRTENSNGEWFNFSKKTFEDYCYHNDVNLKNGLSYYENRKMTAWGNVKVRGEQTNIQFDTLNEAKNFYNLCNTLFFKFCFKSIMVDVHVHPDFLPWLGDAINPRTGKKGYTGEWTDDDLYKLFNLTKDEIKIIEETMKKYEV